MNLFIENKIIYFKSNCENVMYFCEYDVKVAKKCTFLYLTGEAMWTKRIFSFYKISASSTYKN